MDYNCWSIAKMLGWDGVSQRKRRDEARSATEPKMPERRWVFANALRISWSCFAKSGLGL